MQTVAVIDYGSGNLRSAERALQEAARMTGAPWTIKVTANAGAVKKADRIVLPGVGAFGDCWAGLNAISGMRDALEFAVRKKGRPFLGVCVGMQLMAERGLEHGQHKGLGWIKGDVVPLVPGNPNLKIPHMGWNEVVPTKSSALFPHDRNAAQEFYFVHSYVMQPSDPAVIAAKTNHGVDFCSAVFTENLAGVQFHPEKSQRVGLALLKRFLEWRP